MTPPKDTTSTEDLILERIKSMATDLRKLSDDMINVRVDISALRVKSSVWGALAGLLPALGVLLYMVLSK